MAFTAIEAAEGLGRAERRRVADVGPPGVLVRTGHPSLLASAGFVDIVVEDVTAAYRSTIDAWLRATERHRAEAVAAVGGDEYEARQQRRADALGAVDAGILERRLYVARRPHAGRDRSTASAGGAPST